MSVRFICASHSPLMQTDINATDEAAHKDYYDHMAAASRELADFDPEVVVVFAPDHFNGFFFDLMPSFCIGLKATGMKDWSLDPGPLNVPRDLAMDCVRALHQQDIDVAVSYDMGVDHGTTIPLFKLAGSLDRYPVMPIFVNCAADPRPTFRRVRAFGDAVGRFLADKGLRVAVIGSGGLSHDPPTPRIQTAPPEVADRLIHRHVASREELDGRQARVIQAAKNLVVGEGPCLPPSEEWDRQFLDDILEFRTDRLDSITDEEIDRDAGFGGHEVRSWVAAAAAARALGMRENELASYRLIPEWITGMGVICGRG